MNKSKKIKDTTTNRYVYNRSYKNYLVKKGRLNCVYCGYHSGENSSNKFYGTLSYETKLVYPNWKLVSKNKKQWMNKNLRFITEKRYSRSWVHIVW